MIISISPPSSVSLRIIEKQTKSYFGADYSFNKSKNGLLVTKDDIMVLVKKQEILLSFSESNTNAIILLQKYLLFLFKNVYIGVDFMNPITNNLKFAINLPLGVLS